MQSLLPFKIVMFEVSSKARRHDEFPFVNVERRGMHFLNSHLKKVFHLQNSTLK